MVKQVASFGSSPNIWHVFFRLPKLASKVHNNCLVCKWLKISTIINHPSIVLVIDLQLWMGPAAPASYKVQSTKFKPESSRVD